jgi:tripartite-type tricarboxylate transporter receptor subunit TctC
MAGELFKLQAKVDVLHVPYKGSAPALTDLIGGQVQFDFDNMPSAWPHVQAGKLRALAVTSAKPTALAPQLQTMAQAGLPGYEAGIWFALFAPAGTPSPIIDRAAQAVAKATAAPAFRERLAAQGAEPMTGTPESLTALVKTESARFARLIRDAAIRAE